MPYGQSPLQTEPYRNIYIKEKTNIKIYCRKLYYYNPEKNFLTIILSNSPFNIALDNDGNIAELQQVLSAAKVLLQTTSQYTQAMFSLLLGISILYMTTIWWKNSPRQLYCINETWTALRTLLYKLLNTICMQYHTKYHYSRIGDEHLD